MRKQNLIKLSILTFVVSLLTGCQTEVPNVSPNSSPVEEQYVTDIIITGDGLQLLYAPQEIAELLPYNSNVANAIIKIGEALNSEPIITFIPTDSNCTLDTTHATWGNFDLSFEGTDAELTDRFKVALSSEPTSSNGVYIGAYNHVTIGANAETVKQNEFLVSDPNLNTSFMVTDEESGIIYEWIFIDSWSITPPPYEGKELYGVKAYLVNNILAAIYAPEYFINNC